MEEGKFLSYIFGQKSYQCHFAKLKFSEIKVRRK